ncbi:hypothetical protein [Paenibacillus donghaensis]|uniref:Uncharacterized protein n=1 Tax=Paenibacillus donghaensis TaxID=414771 RepID=A0A2Z2KD14_9BACL|nr:hypothetical protein [Paenibacillus donghaensis]ASA24606.1 hypothetical protein B9T62_29945 [Paenibacillus donghaensis]
MKMLLEITVRKMWTSIEHIVRRTVDFLKSNEGRQMLIQVVIVWGIEFVSMYRCGVYPGR